MIEHENLVSKIKLMALGRVLRTTKNQGNKDILAKEAIDEACMILKALSDEILALKNNDFMKMIP